MSESVWRLKQAVSILVITCGAFFIASCDSAGVPGGNNGPATPGHITGRVMFNDLPVEGATIEIDDDSFGTGVATAVTDADGRYSIAITPIHEAGVTEITIWAYHPDDGFLIFGWSETVVSEYQNIVRDFTMTREFDITNPPDGATGVSLTPTVTWDAVSEAVTYSLVIMRETSSTATSTTYTWEHEYYDLTATTFAVPSGNLKSGETYRIRIEGFNANGTRVAGHEAVIFDT
jgi:hypothetical protein